MEHSGLNQEPGQSSAVFNDILTNDRKRNLVGLEQNLVSSEQNLVGSEQNLVGSEQNMVGMNSTQHLEEKVNMYIYISSP